MKEENVFKIICGTIVGILYGAFILFGLGKGVYFSGHLFIAIPLLFLMFVFKKYFFFYLSFLLAAEVSFFITLVSMFSGFKNLKNSNRKSID